MSKKIIICIDDEKLVLDSLKKEIRENLGDGYIIEVAESGAEALELFKELLDEGFDVPLIISDYIMPEMKGDEVLRKAKEIKPETYSIMLSGQATIEGVTNAINKAGLYRYISKPWDSDDVAISIKEALKCYDKDIELIQKRKELEIANSNLIKLDSAKTYFLGLLSNELNTPLVEINGNAKLIYQMTDDEDIIESAQLILKSEARLRKFSELSLLITRIQTDKYKISFFMEKIQELLHSVLLNFDNKCKEKNVEIIDIFTNLNYMANIDTSLILKVFEIIIDNAIKLTPEGSKIFLTSVIDSGKLNIKIIDQGPGFSNQILSNSFELFSSSENLLNHSEGTGLSLAAAKVIMEMHNFSINLRNTSEGHAEVEMIF
jgi:signal transduction histidine kinase